jgi:hypothetical protein
MRAARVKAGGRRPVRLVGIPEDSAALGTRARKFRLTRRPSGGMVRGGINRELKAAVPIANRELHENMEIVCPRSILVSGVQRTSCVGRHRIGSLQILSRTPFGEPRAMAPTRRPAAFGE